MAFIRRSGIRPMMAALKNHCDHGRPLRILTTTYTGSTEELALDELHQLGAEVFVSYDVTTTRLHAKAWLFHRAREACPRGTRASQPPTSAPPTSPTPPR